MSLVILLWLGFAPVFGQQIKTDIFGNLQYESRDRQYTATLKKNIFDQLIFADSRKNEITYEKEYLDREHPSILSDKNIQTGFFRELLRNYRRESNYVAKYEIDILDNLIIEDNRGYRLKQRIDIFGNSQIEEEFDGVKTSVKRNIHGGLEYSSGREKASLKKDIFDKWTYEDSTGNKFQFSPETWEKLIHGLRTDEEVFLLLIEQFFTM